ncbi:hypothetical protein GN956_G13960 [Arapaima gigas]
MADDKQCDPLHYFMSGDLSSSSDSEDEGGGSRTSGTKEHRSVAKAKDGESQDTRRAAAGAALPKPDDLFRSVSKPAFLYNPLNKNIDWESRIVKAPEEPPKEFKVWKTNAVPPPQSYITEKKSAPPGRDMAIKWSNVYEDNGDDAPCPPAGKAGNLPNEEQPSHSDEEKDHPKSAKKRKVESFQQKEKRKRDLGQATSDKNFVEEEKRILRQSLY